MNEFISAFIIIWLAVSWKTFLLVIIICIHLRFCVVFGYFGLLKKKSLSISWQSSSIQ